MEITDEECQSGRAKVSKKLETLSSPEVQVMVQAAIMVRTLDDAWPRATRVRNVIFFGLFSMRSMWTWKRGLSRV